jgi:hypothetical protein
MFVEQENMEHNIGKDNNITQPKIHTMPRGVVNLENLFDLREIFKNPKNFKTGSSCLTYEVINLGSVNNPKNINLGKSLSPEEKKSLLEIV